MNVYKCFPGSFKMEDTKVVLLLASSFIWRVVGASSGVRIIGVMRSCRVSRLCVTSEFCEDFKVLE